MDHDDFICPCCGAELPLSAHFCRHCGASEDSGWGTDDDSEFDEDDNFDYEEFLRREFPDNAPPPPHPGPKKIVFGLIVVLLLCLLLMSLWPSS